MTYSGIAAAIQRKMTAQRGIFAAQPHDTFDDIVADIRADAAQRGRPVDMSEAGYVRILDEIDSLDAITVPVDGLSKIATSDEHDDEPQAQALQAVAGTSPSSSPVRTITSYSHPLSTPSRTPSPIPTPTAPKQPSTSWRDVSEHHKFNEACRAADDLEGFAFSLDLSARVERTLWTHENPCRLLSGYINKALKAQGIAGTPYAFAVEYAPLQENYRGELRSKLHLHGVVVSDDPAKVKAALMAAGGNIVGKSRSRQVKLAEFDARRGGGNGWSVYALKDEDRTWRHIDGDRVIFLNDALRGIVRDRWQERHPITRRQRKTAVLTHTAPAAVQDEQSPSQARGTIQGPPMARSGVPALMMEVAQYAERKKPSTGETPPIEGFVFVSERAIDRRCAQLQGD